jgi:hypothetical protein
VKNEERFAARRIAGAVVQVSNWHAGRASWKLAPQHPASAAALASGARLNVEL